MKTSEKYIPLASLADLPECGVVLISKDEERYLVVKNNSDIHVIRDKCGHFGVSLLNGDVQGDEIRCAVHGAKFSLKTGEVLNDLFEDCDPLNVYSWRIINGMLEVIK